jgi:hypothetical protein
MQDLQLQRGKVTCTFPSPLPSRTIL